MPPAMHPSSTPRFFLTKEIMLEVSSEGCVQNRQRAVGARKEGLQARDIASAKALGLEKEELKGS